MRSRVRNNSWQRKNDVIKRHYQSPTVETPRVAPPYHPPQSAPTELETPSEPVQGIKRSYSESEDGLGSVAEEASQSEEDRPIFPVARLYTGESWKEYEDLMGLLGNRFADYKEYYRPDCQDRRISEGLRCVTEDIGEKWETYARSIEGEPTWRKFCLFLQENLPERNPKDSRILRQYHAAKQRPHQSVKDFASHLGLFEGRLKRPLSEKERIRALWQGILPEIQEEAKMYYAVIESEIYERHIMHLEAVENAMQSRAPVTARKQVEQNQRTKRRRGNH